MDGGDPVRKGRRVWTLIATSQGQDDGRDDDKAVNSSHETSKDECLIPKMIMTKGAEIIGRQLGTGLAILFGREYTTESAK